MKKIVLALFLLAFALQSQAQKLAPVKWDYQAVKTGEKQYNIIITANVDAPWHIYSQFVKKGPVPTTVQFAKNPLVLLNGATKEVGKLEKKFDKNFDAVIGSFGAHATTIGAENMQFSADYPGYWQRKMEQGSVDLAIFCGGSVGSQSPSGEGNGFEKPKKIGESLADSLEINLAKLELKDKIDMSALSLKMDLPDYNIRLTTKMHFSTWLSKKLMPLPENVYLQVIKIGNLIWFTTPCDFSGEFARQLKDGLATKGFNANVTSFNGSYVGYIIPGKYFYLDAYEPKTMGWFGPNMGEYTFELLRHLSEIITQPVQ
jgi:hypothetical protein